MANELKIENGLIVNGSATISGDLSATGEIYGYTNGNPMPTNYPNPSVTLINAGTSFQNKSIKEMFDIILYPTLFPVLTNPSASLASITTPREIGSLVNISLAASLNRGSINPDYSQPFPYGTGFRSGSAASYTFTGPSAVSTPILTNDSSYTQTINNYKIVVDNQTWQVVISALAGPQPLDSKGNPFNSPYGGGTVTASRTVQGVYPVYATTVTIGTLTKQTIVAKNTTPYTVTLVSEDLANRHTVEFPSNWNNVTGIRYFNPISGQFEYFGGSAAQSLTYWTVVDINKNTDFENNVPYKRYVYNYTDSPVGSRQIRFER
jgi:hypothetical protein